MKLKILPKRGRVIDPKTRKPIAKEGATVRDSTYWRRRLRDGDVELVKPKPKKATINKEGQV